jgi:phosphohistidine phosphatase SixA
MRYLLILLAAFIFCSCGSTIYVVRHAEKAPQAGNNSDVALSTEGQQRAQTLKSRLANEKIEQVYSTNTIRTKSTAQPTADHFGLSINTYGPRPDTAFINLLKASKKNTLVVGHSNTVDDIANMLIGQTVVAGDLKDSEYDNLYIIKRKGDKFVFKGEKYGASSN